MCMFWHAVAWNSMPWYTLEGLSMHCLTHVMSDCTGRHEWDVETQQTQGL